MKTAMRLFLVTFVCVSLVPLASATLCSTGQFESDLTIISINGVDSTGNVGSVCVSGLNETTTASGQTATITFIAAPGIGFIDGNVANINTLGGSATSSGSTVTESPDNTQFKDFTTNQNVNGFGNFNLSMDNKNASTQEQTISFTVTNTSGTTWTSASTVLAFNALGFDASAHIIGGACGTSLTCFAGETFAVPEPRFYGLLLTGLMALVGKTFFRRRAT